MARVGNGWLFRAEATRIPWAVVARRSIVVGNTHVDGAQLDALLSRTAGRNDDIHLTWACSHELGVPRGPFLVWVRRKRSQLKSRAVKPVVSARPEGLRIRWGGVEAAVVDVTFDPVDSKQPSALFLFRTGGSLWDTVGSAIAPAGGPAGQILHVACSGATTALLVNGTNPRVRILTLDAVVNDPGWEPLERVGLPVERPWAGTAYDTTPQGLLVDPLPPPDAAIWRLKRGAPPIGWPLLTQTGVLAPAWQDADPEGVVKEVMTTLLPEIAAMYAGNVPEYRQALIEDVRPVPGPTQDGRTSSLDAAATTRPWSLLALPAQTDPLLNLATGFGATYVTEGGHRPELAVGDSDFLVTADFARPTPPIRAKSTLAAYAPQQGPHEITAPATTLTTERAGLVAPRPADTPWRESIRVSWDRPPTTAALGRTPSGALATWKAGASSAQILNPPRDAGGVRPLTLGPDGPPGSPGAARTALVDAAADIPILSGGRHVGYAVSQVDVHGVWSAWRDRMWAGIEPGPLPPRLISLALDSSYAGSANCPGTLRLEAALDWTERTPSALEIVAVFYPMASAASPPPLGVDPTLPAPAGCFRRDLSVTFAGDVPTGLGCTVTPLGPDGDQVMAPGPGQGDGGRRYRITATVPTLDFSGTLRWGSRCGWRSRLVVGASPTAYIPDAAHPARTVAASPVPVVPLPPPAPPGVPMGSTPDAQGCSHVRVTWSLPGGGAGVRTCVVWECAETALRQRAGLTVPPPETDSPGVRLAALWSAYDAMTDVQRRAAFRRLLELDGSARAADVTLPKGSTDIHLFVVTTQSTTGIESPWPSSPSPAHVHVQAAMAPRLRRPAPPLARVVVDTGGTPGAVSATLYAASTVPVERFLVFATRSEAAARDRESMGPAVANLPVTVPPAGTDPVMGSPVYQVNWAGVLTPAWDPWLVRVVAQPVATVPVQAVRGLPSAASEVTSVFVPPTGPPTLEPLVGSRWGADHSGVLVVTATTAPVRDTPSGPHRISAVVDGTVVPLVDLSDLPESSGAAPPSGASAAPVFERGPRVAGRSPLRLWLPTPDATQPAVVSLRLVDPLGRATEVSVTVPGFVAPPAYTLVLGSVAVVAGGVVVGLETNAPARAADALRLDIAAAPADLVVLGPRSKLRGSFPLAEIPVAKPFFPADGAIHVVSPPRAGLPRPPRYAVFVPLDQPLRFAVTLAGPAGPITSVTARL